MSSIPKQTLCSVIPCIRYRDAPAAIEWLRGTFGFDVQFVVPSEDGLVAHAQLRFGNGMVMLSSTFDTEYGRLLRHPADSGGFVTQSTYLVVNDADEVYRRVKEAGGAILLDIKDEDYGGRGFTCSDPEGHIWSIGTYDPYA
ncbi:glyoxalase [Duganella sp. FT135W]|uniref:Glyoxalase n=1 Tax=Duganella flavida TaxID=2692175 RepID=A0A6L8K6J0_9BURK|nr:VOC family protein [Duganella flavida]MYM21798.1 glyoxalase [Duganella flavida]